MPEQPDQLPSRCATATPQHRLSRGAWFAFGLVAGFALACCVGAVAIGLLMLAAPREGQLPAGINALRPGPRPADRAQVARAAQLVAAPLVQSEHGYSPTSESEIRAAFGLRLQQADALARENTELAPIAAEYAEALRTAQSLIESVPSPQPLLREALSVWRGGVNDDSRELVTGLLGVGMEFSKISEVSDRAASIHARVMACRLRLAEAAMRTAPPEVSGSPIQLGFSESGVDPGVTSDRIWLQNISGARRTDVVIVTELAGESGERFSNCYFVDRWEPGQTLLAICRSEQPGRETVHHVTLVRCRAIAAEKSSRVIDLTR